MMNDELKSFRNDLRLVYTEFRDHIFKNLLFGFVVGVAIVFAAAWFGIL